MNKVLVTGATGNVGSHVVRELRQRGVPVRAFVRDAARATARLGEVELALGDFADEASVRRALVGVDSVFLACGNVPARVLNPRYRRGGGYGCQADRQALGLRGRGGCAGCLLGLARTARGVSPGLEPRSLAQFIRDNAAPFGEADDVTTHTHGHEAVLGSKRLGEPR